MIEDTAAYVTSAVVRVVGEQHCQFDLHNWGSRYPMITMQLGPVLCRVGQPHLTVEHVLEVWRTAAIQAARLPRRLAPGGHRRPTDVGTAVVLRLQALPACAATLMPAQHSTPAHLMLKVGPVTWQVLDQLAYRSMTGLWQQARHIVKPES